jgi:hypothetical protein
LASVTLVINASSQLLLSSTVGTDFIEPTTDARPPDPRQPARRGRAVGRIDACDTPLTVVREPGGRRSRPSW